MKKWIAELPSLLVPSIVHAKEVSPIMAKRSKSFSLQSEFSSVILALCNLNTKTDSVSLSPKPIIFL
jgi:hypothetical protein